MTATTLHTLYVVLAAGAAGLYLCLPSARSLPKAGAVLGAAALAALAVGWTRWLGPEFAGRAFFVLFAMIAVAASACVITQPRPVYSALYFVLTVLAVAALCVLGAAELLGAALVIVYAGAIMVVYLFVIMLAQQGGAAAYDARAREPFAAVVLAFLLAAAATQAVAREPSAPSAAEPIVTRPVNEPGPADDATGDVRRVGAELMTRYILAVELAGLLLLVAMVGAIAIAHKEIEPDAMTPEERSMLEAAHEDLRRRGREAAPF